MKKIALLFITFLYASILCMSQTAYTEIIYLKANTLEYKYKIYNKSNSATKGVIVCSTNIDTRGYIYLGANYCRPTKFKGNIQAITNEVLKHYPNEKLPNELLIHIYYSLKKETITVGYSYESPTGEIISPYSLEDLSNALIKGRKLIELTMFKPESEFPFDGIYENKTVKIK